MVDIRGKLSLNISNDLTGYVRLSQIRRVLIHAGCVTCKAHLNQRSIRILHEIPMMGMYVAEVPMRSLPALASMGYIKHIEDDARVKLNIDRARRTVSADISPAISLTGKGITIALVDSGIFPHADFGKPSRVKYFLDLVDSRAEPYDDNGHGTFCAGMAVGDGTASEGKYTGIAKEADVVMIKAMDKTGNGRISDILRAFQWISDNAKTYNIRVVSMSVGIDPLMINPFRDTLAEAAGALWQQGMVVVAAAGNSGPKEGSINSPGTSPRIITVGAADDRSTPGEITVAKFSSRDKEGGGKPDIISPGVDIKGPINIANDYVVMSGTSMATPIVAGCAALILEKYPYYTPDQVKKTLMDNALSIAQLENHQGKGVISLKGIF